MGTFNLSESDLKSILAEVDADLDKVLKSESDLVKAEESSMSKASPDEASPEVSGSPAEASGGGDEGSAGGPPPEMGGHDDSEMPPHDEAAEAAGPEMGGAPAPDAGMGEEPLESKLKALPLDQLRHLYLAVKAAMFELLGGAQADAGAAMGAPAPAAGSAAPSAAPSAGAPSAAPMAMAEDSFGSSSSSSSEGSARKAEGDPDKLASDGKVSAPAGKKLAAVGKAEGDPDGLASDGKVRAPAPRAAPAPSPKNGKQANGEVAKAEPVDVKSLRKSEITVLLKDLDYSKLTKKDREAINGFYDSKHDVSKISHLLGDNIEARLGLNKSEAEGSDDVQSLRAQNDELNKKVEGLAKAVNLLMTTPLRKAVTTSSQINIVPKPGNQGGPDVRSLSKSEVTAKLKELDYSQLTKKDRDAINGFYDNRHGVDKIQHLLN